MLVLHSSSRCDVCLSEYSWETAGKRPHAIACGHIFCRDCLYTNSPPLCPLCRKLYLPNKMKKLHVDKPENIDDHKEIDLLQRLAISWESAEEQLHEVTEEVDMWLRDRSDDACIALRKARAALDKNRELKEYGESLHDTIGELEAKNQLLEIGLQKEQQKSFIQAEAYRTMVDGLNKDVVRLKQQIEGMSAISNRYTYSRNPLPRPPEPISTDRVPTFEQAVSESGLGVRFVELPTSPHRQPFELEPRSHKRGKSKSKSKELRFEEEVRYRSASPQQAPPTPQSPASHYVRPHVSAQSPQYERSPTSTRASALQTHFASTNQPVDLYSTMSVYVREYTSGYINGQEVAYGMRMTEGSDNRTTRTQAAQFTTTNSNRYAEQPSSAYEPRETYRPSPAANAYQNQPYSAPVRTDRSSRSGRRPETASSIISSSVESSRNDRPSSRSQTRTGNGAPSMPSYQTYQVHQAPSSPRAPSGYPVVASNTLVRPPSRRGSSAPPSPPIPSQPQQIIPQQPEQLLPAPVPRRTSSIISGRSHQTHQTIDTWGTAPNSNLGSGSLIVGLTAFRTGAEPALVGGQEPMTFRELGSDGASIRTRHSFSDAASDAPNPTMSPPRPVHSMVGVLPSEEDTPSRERDQRPSSHRSQSNVETYSQHDWHQPANAGSGGSRHSLGSGYQNDDDQSQHQYDHRSAGNDWHASSNQDERSNAYRSPTSVDHRAYDTSRTSSNYPRERSHTSSSSRFYSNQEDNRRQSLHQDDQYSVASSRSSRRVPPQSRVQHMLLPEESPFPVTVEYTDDDQQTVDRRSRRESRSDSPEASPPASAESYGNALGLQLSPGISAPTPVVSTRAFLRSYSREY